MKSYRVLLLYILAVASILAVAMFGSLVVERLTYHPPSVTVETSTVTVTETVTVEVPKLIQPESCKRSVELADELKKAAGAFDSRTSKQVDIMSAAARMIADNNQQGLNKLIQEQRDLNNETLADAVRLSTGLREYDKARSACEEETR